MNKVIYKYTLLPGAHRTDDYDAMFGITRRRETLVELPLAALLLSIGCEREDDSHEYDRTVGWFMVPADPIGPVELRRFFFAYTGAEWPERRFLGTVFPAWITSRRRVVHVFGGGVA